MTYGQDFPETWLGYSLIIGASSGVPIKKGAMETISAATAPSKGKDVRPKKMKAVDVDESTGGVEIGSEMPNTLGISGRQGCRGTFGFKDPEEDQGRVFFFPGSCDCFSPWFFRILWFCIPASFRTL